MPVPSSGPISVGATLPGEFGGAAPHSMSEYYRGGGLVPNTGTNAAVPTSGSISMSQFRGAAGGGSALSVGRSPPDITRTRLGSGSGTLTGSVTISASGGTGSYTYSTVWLSGGSGISITGAATANPGVTSTAVPYTNRTGTLRTTVSDGVSSVSVDTPVSLTWEA